ncbi:MAG: hypothetical protein C0404_11235 [Verrucomicrobia bacterium]|nr:hypothetical protein [Verrucomicrobiota bacterium]
MNQDRTTEESQSGAPDEVLMRLSGEGDQAAFAALVRKHQDPLVNFFHRMGAYMDAEDLAQETFVRLFKYRDRYRATAKFTTFLYTVARHTWLDLMRKDRRRDLLVDGLRADTPGSDDSSMKQVQLRMDAAAALKLLPEKLRSVVVMSLYQGLRYDEIAAILEIPEGTVKSRMFNALSFLRERLEK